MLEAVQADYRPFLIWIIKRLNKKFKWFTEDTIIDIQYHTRDTLNEDEKLDIVGKKVDIANKAGYNVKMAWLASELGMEGNLQEKEVDALGMKPSLTKDGKKVDPKEESESKDGEEDTKDEK